MLKQSMRILTLFFCVALSACAHLGNSKSEAVVQLNADEQSYYTRCDGAFEKWDTCGKRANTTCAKGWHLIDQEERPNSKRMLMFQCNR